MYIVWMMYDSLMIPVEECGLNFLTFVWQLRKTLEEHQRKLTRPEIEHGPCAWEVTVLLLGQSGGPPSCRLHMIAVSVYVNLPSVTDVFSCVKEEQIKLVSFEIVKYSVRERAFFWEHAIGKNPVAGQGENLNLDFLGVQSCVTK